MRTLKVISAPTDPSVYDGGIEPGDQWYDTDSGVTKTRNQANTDWDLADASGAAAAVHTHTLADVTDAGTAAAEDADAFEVAGAAAAAQSASQPVNANLTALAAASSPAIVKTATVAMTDAQVKALTATQVVAAPGAGFAVLPVGIAVVADCAAGAYTNINGSASFSVGFASVMDVLPFAEASGGAVTGLLGAAAVKTAALPTTFLGALSDWENKALIVKISNNAAGDFTGGNAANTLTVTVLYVTVAV